MKEIISRGGGMTSYPPCMRHCDEEIDKAHDEL
jgi:hypothetical protein